MTKPKKKTLTARDKIRRLIYAAGGLVLYVVDARFRTLVKLKMEKGTDDTIRHGETVVAVLNSDQENRRVIQ